MAGEINIGGIKITIGGDSRPLEDAGGRAEATLRRTEFAANSLRSALGWMSGFVGFTVLAQQVGQAVGRLEEMNRLSRQVDRALEVTGNTAQTTSSEMRKYAEQLEASTGRAAEEIMDLGANLASYGFTHDVFYRSIALANDMSAAWGGDLRQNLEGLARALDDPIQGFAMLSKRGIKLTQDQKDLVTELIRTNKHIEAQQVVFDALEAQVSGVAEAGFQGLTRAMHTAQQVSENFFESLVKAIDLPGQMESGLNAAAAAMGTMAANADTIVSVSAGLATALGVVLLPTILSTTAAWGALAVAMLANPMVQLAVVAGTLAGALVYLNQQQHLAAQAAAEHETAIGENANAIEIAKTSSERFRSTLREQISAQLAAAKAALDEAGAQYEAARATAVRANAFGALMKTLSTALYGEGRDTAYGDDIMAGALRNINDAYTRVQDLQTQLEELDTVIETIPPAEEVYTSSATVDDKKGAKAQEQAEQRLEQLRTSLLTEEEAELESYNKRLEQLQEFLDKGMITQSEYADLRERAEQQHQEKLTEIVRQQDELRRRLQTETISRISGVLDGLTGLLEKSGEEQFGIAKGIAVATALLKGYEAVTSAYAAGTALGGPPVGMLFAGLAAAQTAMQIANLRSVTSSSSGSPVVGSAGAVSTAEANSGVQAITIGGGISRNSLYSGDAIYELIDRINAAQADGKRVHVL